MTHPKGWRYHHQSQDTQTDNVKRLHKLNHPYNTKCYSIFNTTKKNKNKIGVIHINYKILLNLSFHQKQKKFKKL
jgi:hypothetical protein